MTANRVGLSTPADCDRTRHEGHYASYRRILTQRGVSHDITISHRSLPLPPSRYKHQFQRARHAWRSLARASSALDAPVDDRATGKKSLGLPSRASFPHHTPQVISSLKLNPSDVVNYHLKIAVGTKRRVKGGPRRPGHPITIPDQQQSWRHRVRN